MGDCNDSLVICLPREIHAVTAQRISLGSSVERKNSIGKWKEET
jgi:hypothetical protein